MIITTDSSLYVKFLLSPRIPLELVLETIQYLPFHNGALVSALRNAHPRLRALVSTYEQSLTRHFMRKELRHAATDFPCGSDPNIEWLANCVQNYDIIDNIMDCFCSKYISCAVFQHNVSLANTGLLLLYRISSLEMHTEKLSYIKSLERDPLIAVYLVLHHATRFVREHVSGWIKKLTDGGFMEANQLELRNELEFCFAEAALSIGLGFISDALLYHDISDWETTLLNVYHEHGTHDWDWSSEEAEKGEFEPPRTQGPRREESEKEKSLFMIFLERMAELTQYSLSDVRARVELDLESAAHPLAYLTLGGKERLLQGKDLDVADE